MWHLVIWISGGLGNTMLIVVLGNLKGLFQPKPFYDITLFWLYLFSTQNWQGTCCFMGNGRRAEESLWRDLLRSDHCISCDCCVSFWSLQFMITDVYVSALHLNAINISLVEQKGIIVPGSISNSLSHLFVCQYMCFTYMLLKTKRNIFLILNEILVF